MEIKHGMFTNIIIEPIKLKCEKIHESDCIIVEINYYSTKLISYHLSVRDYATIHKILFKRDHVELSKIIISNYIFDNTTKKYLVVIAGAKSNILSTYEVQDVLDVLPLISTPNDHILEMIRSRDERDAAMSNFSTEKFMNLFNAR